MPITAAQGADFEVYARNPDTWAFAAKRNLAVARVLDAQVQVLRARPSRDVLAFSGCLLSSMMHAALAVKNAVKGVYIKRDPAIVSKQRLNLPPAFGRTGHALHQPIVAILGPLAESELRLIVKLEESGWAGRFVVPFRAASIYDEAKLQIMRSSHPQDFPMVESFVDRLLVFLAPHAA